MEDAFAVSVISLSAAKLVVTKVEVKTNVPNAIVAINFFIYHLLTFEFDFFVPFQEFYVTDYYFISISFYFIYDFFNQRNLFLQGKTC
ncbi:MAG: hypothetical protein AMJ61_13725 [Desulfobacterales bacterium SG8_35_2]|nr:MAG: hypothetical protein AMJ61_13725 [Desulfobacterales bacterium SG8_35_2]